MELDETQVHVVVALYKGVEHDVDKDLFKLSDSEWLSKFEKVDGISLKALLLEQIRTLRKLQGESIPVDRYLKWWYEGLQHAQKAEENSSTQAYLEHTTSVPVEERVKKQDLMQAASSNPKIIRPRANIITKEELRYEIE